MRLGINLLCVTDFVEEKHVPILELAKRTGFDLVEIPVLKGSPGRKLRIYFVSVPRTSCWGPTQLLSWTAKF